MHKIRFLLGLQTPLGELTARTPELFKEPTSKGRAERKRRRRGKGGGEREKKMRGK